MADSSDEVRLTLRLPARVRDHLLKRGKESGRSLNAEIVSRLERSVDFEDEYGTLEQVMQEVWNDIDQLKNTVREHDERLNPMDYDWK